MKFHLVYDNMFFNKKAQKNSEQQISTEEFKTATGELYKRNLELADLYKKLEVLNSELGVANDKLKNLDQLKSEFLSLASHQLRSPLTAIKGYASMLIEESFGTLSEGQDKAAKRIYASAQGLSNIVEDLLNISKIEQGGMKYEFAPVDLTKIVTELYEEMKIAAENKELKLTLNMPTDKPCMAVVDALKIKQVFLNLVDNSIKYTLKGKVTISLSCSTDTVYFSVTDTGVGISSETKDKLCAKFSRGEGGKMNTGGSGLGLYLAREITRAHKGDITITSDGIEKGTTFTVTLPALAN